MNRHKLIVLAGPTASGKTALSIKLAKKFHGEIISADSRQVYRGMDIGTGKVTKKEQRQVRHHLLDVANPKRQFSVAQYQKLAKKSLRDIAKREKLPIIVGGTGLYIESIIYNQQFPTVAPNPGLRKQLEKLSAERLFAMLKKLDPARAETIDGQNPRRLIRAIEIAKRLGRVPPLPRQAKLHALILGIKISQVKLRQNINRRLDARIAGTIREIRTLRKRGISYRRLVDFGLEYRYFSWYLQGRLTKQQAVAQLKTAIWRYAKRQYAWLKRLPVVWVRNEHEASAKVRRFFST